ncbi:MAG TPA: hypothetical protein VNJ07_00225, partial [Chitinophagales bacterium]|nr:hypothetical protein [Chitinophagales bacterium]
DGIVEFKRGRKNRCFVNLLPVKTEPAEVTAVESSVEAPIADEAEDKPRKRKKVEPESEN